LELVDMKTKRLRTRTPLELVIERILWIAAVLGLTCLGIGLLIHIIGRAWNNLFVARVGAYLLVMGIMLTATRILYWIMEKIVERGLESMTKNASVQHHRILNDFYDKGERKGKPVEPFEKWLACWP